MNAKPDVRVREAALWHLPVTTRIPLKFGRETTAGVTCARVRLRVENSRGHSAEGWGETPLSVAWLWPGELAFADRDQALREFSILLAGAVAGFFQVGHPMEIGWTFIRDVLPVMLHDFNRSRPEREAMPWLAALTCYSPYDLALHDAYAALNGVFVYDTYGPDYMNHDLTWYYGADAPPEARGKNPVDFLVKNPPDRLPVWHLVGGRDALSPEDLTGNEPDDGHPVLLRDWIARDGVRCLKVKLTGESAAGDYDRLAQVGDIARECGCEWLSADFNCCVADPAYVQSILDRLLLDRPWLLGMLLYIEQPFPRDLASRRLDVRALAARKPLYLDESADDWRMVELGRTLGWNGVALKTCKTQTGALLSLCWARMRGMGVMVQDLTNPMLAAIPHVLLAAHAGTIHGVEANASQFYPAASEAEAAVHPGLYRRRHGEIVLDSIGNVGFGYRIAEIRRLLPEPAARA